jgi:hypothetical protein
VDGIWPADLVERFRAGRVALFIGAGCARSAGLPDWKGLLEAIRDRFRNRGSVSDDDLRRLKGWWGNTTEYPRIAQFFFNQERNAYRNAMESIFDPARPPQGRQPPRYFHYFSSLGVSTIVTTNFDSLLEDADMGKGYTSITWQDDEDFARFLREERGLIFHLHGTARRSGTLVHTHDEYQKLRGPEGRQAFEFLGRIFEQKTILFVGYSLSDSEIGFVSEQYHQNWNRRPDWYLLSANPAPEQIAKAREELGLTLIPYTPIVDQKDGYGAAIDRMFVDLGGQLGIAELGTPAPDVGHASDQPFVLVTPELIRDSPVTTQEAIRQFYRGNPPTWSLLRDAAAVTREIVSDVIRRIDKGSQFLLLTGAGGEGKSTALRQVALALATRGDRTFFATANEDLDLRDLLRRERGRIVVVIDDAEDLRNASQLVRLAQGRKDTTLVVLAARPNEWREKHGKDVDLNRIVESVPIPRLSGAETRAIAHLIHESGANRTNADEETLAARLLNDTNGFLLAAMLVATQGRQLLEILRDVVQTASSWPDGEILVSALALVVAHESKLTPRGNRIFCSQRLFRDAMGGISAQRMHQLCNRFTGEISLTPRGGYRIETRHPVIADALAAVLFDPQTPLVDELEINERIVSSAGRFSRNEVSPGERKLLTTFPMAFGRAGRSDDARRLFQASTEADPHDAPTWQAWALMEKDANNIGDTKTPGTARFLFNKGTEADPHNAPTWQAWALMELQLGEIAEANRLSDAGLILCPTAPELLWLRERLKAGAQSGEVATEFSAS